MAVDDEGAPHPAGGGLLPVEEFLPEYRLGSGYR